MGECTGLDVYSYNFGKDRIAVLVPNPFRGEWDVQIGLRVVTFVSVIIFIIVEQYKWLNAEILL